MSESDKTSRPEGDEGKGRNRRNFWREKSHRESHALPLDAAGPLAAHPLASADPPVMVATTDGLAAMIEQLATAGTFAFDSEFIGECSYEPRLCLVQAATTSQVFLVDPLAELDLAPLWELIAAPRVEKIVLAGQQDLLPAVLRTRRPPANILDVQIAAGFVHADYPLSLARLLQEFLGIAIGKGLTFTHWDHRPLSAVQVRYAADDVRYLPAARHIIGQRLAEQGRTDWARQESAATLEDLSLYLPAPETLYLRVRGRDRLGQRHLAVLRELAAWRDRAARREDVPARTLVKDGILVGLSRRMVKTPQDLADIRGLPRPVEARYGHEIIEATARALASPPNEFPTPAPADSFEFGDRVDAIADAVNQFCVERSLAPALVASRKELLRACRAAMAGEPLEPHRIFRGWRKELLGDLIGRML